MKKNLLNAISVFLVGATATTLVSCGGSGSDIDMSLLPVKSGKTWQYINAEGKIEINPQFEYAGYFIGGVARVATSGDKKLYGFIDKKGSYVINATYKDATDFSDGLACVVPENGAPTYINDKGEVKFKLENAQYASNFNEGRAAFSVLDKEGKELWGFIDTDGKTVIPNQFYSVGPFVNGLAAVKNKDGKEGFCDKDGKMVINFQFENVSFFSEDLCTFEDDKGKYGFIDKEGKIKINPQFEIAYNFVNGIALVANDSKKYGYIDKEGKFKINPQFEDAQPFVDGLAGVANDNKWGFIDEEGKFKINPQFDDVLPFVEGRAFVKSGDKWGVIDKEGKYIINPQFEDINQMDLIVRVLYGKASFDVVRTDFFDLNGFVSPITSLVSNNSLFGLTASSTVADVMAKFKVEESKVSSYSKYISVDTVVGGAKLYVNINFDNYPKNYDFFSGSSTLNSSAKVTGIELDVYGNKISLSDDRRQKVADAVTAYVTGKLGMKEAAAPAEESYLSDIDRLLDSTKSSKDSGFKPSTKYYESAALKSKVKLSKYGFSWEVDFATAAPTAAEVK